MQWKADWESHYSTLIEITDLTELNINHRRQYTDCAQLVTALPFNLVFRITAVNADGVGPPARSSGQMQEG